MTMAWMSISYGHGLPVKVVATPAPVSLQADCQADQVQQQWHHSSGAERSPFVGTLRTLGDLMSPGFL